MRCHDVTVVLVLSMRTDSVALPLYQQEVIATMEASPLYQPDRKNTITGTCSGISKGSYILTIRPVGMQATNDRFFSKERLMPWMGPSNVRWDYKIPGTKQTLLLQIYFRTVNNRSCRQHARTTTETAETLNQQHQQHHQQQRQNNTSATNNTNTPPPPPPTPTQPPPLKLSMPTHQPCL